VSAGERVSEDGRCLFIESRVLGGGGGAAAYTRQQARIFLARGFDERNHLLAHVCRLIVLKLKDFLFACVV
jgi:hypothetical protein